MKRALVLGLAIWAMSAGWSNAADKQVGIGKKFKGPIGLQLYSLRGNFAKDVPGTLDKVKSYGIKYVELAGTYNVTPEKFKQMLSERGLIPVSGHFSYERFRDDPDSVARDAKTLGLKYAGLAWIPHQAPFDEKACRAAAAVFNKAGAALEKQGVQFFYHIHGYEFQPAAQGTLFDLLVKETDPKLVSYEIDIFWVIHPGQDPVALMKQHKKRFSLMHVKDMKKGTQTGLLTGKSDVNNDVALGTGMMDWPAILQAAKKAGVQYYFIEDESDAAAEHIPQSLQFLEQVAW